MLRRVLHINATRPLNKHCLRYLADSVNKDATNEGPLAGVRILDLSRVVAAPMCTMILGDLGAEIIKVENPGSGDDTRKFGPAFLNDESCYFLSMNRNKKSIVIDLKSPKGRDVLKQLAVQSDVLVENFIPGKMAQFGLGYEDLKSIAPKLIYCSISGFGSTGPYKSRPGVDLIGAAIGGLMNVTGPENGDPCALGVPMTDIATGLYAHGAIMAALMEKNKTGKGQRIDCDLLASQVTMMSYVALSYLNAGYESQRLGSRVTNIIPYEAFKTKDGYISIACISNKGFSSLCEALKLSDLSNDPRFSSAQGRAINRHELEPAIRKVFLTNTTEYWLKEFENSHFPRGAVNNMEGVFKDPQVIHKNLVQEVDHPVAGKVKLLGPAVTYSDLNNKIRARPPLLGEHTDAILSDVLSYTKEQIQDLRNEQVVA